VREDEAPGRNSEKEENSTIPAGLMSSNNSTLPSLAAISPTRQENVTTYISDAVNSSDSSSVEEKEDSFPTDASSLIPTNQLTLLDNNIPTPTSTAAVRTETHMNDTIQSSSSEVMNASIIDSSEGACAPAPLHLTVQNAVDNSLYDDSVVDLSDELDSYFIQTNIEKEINELTNQSSQQTDQQINHHTIESSSDDSSFRPKLEELFKSGEIAMEEDKLLPSGVESKAEEIVRINSPQPLLASKAKPVAKKAPVLTAVEQLLQTAEYNSSQHDSLGYKDYSQQVNSIESLFKSAGADNAALSLSPSLLLFHLNQLLKLRYIYQFTASNAMDPFNHISLASCFSLLQHLLRCHYSPNLIYSSKVANKLSANEFKLVQEIEAIKLELNPLQEAHSIRNSLYSSAIVCSVTLEKPEVYECITAAITQLNQRSTSQWILAPVQEINVNNYTNQLLLTQNNLVNSVESNIPAAERYCFNVNQPFGSNNQYDLTNNNMTNSTPSSSLSYAFNLLWTWRSTLINTHIDSSKLQLHQRINHFPTSQHLTRKDLLKKTLDLLIKHKGFKYSQQFKLQPETFVLPAEYNSFVEVYSKYQEQHNCLNYWIIKPPALSRGRGIRLINNLNEINLQEAQIVQRYISNPLTLQGYKFDLRLYVLVNSFQPLEAYIYKEGFARLATHPFSNDLETLHNQFIHLTNYSIQKNNCSEKNELFLGGSKISLGKLSQMLQSEYNIDFNIPNSLLFDRICLLIVKSLLAAQERIGSHPNSFELFGYDILIDSTLKPWLVEINASPSLALDNQLDKQIKVNLMADIFQLINPTVLDRIELQELLEKKLRTGRFETLQPLNHKLKAIAANYYANKLLNNQAVHRYGELPAAYNSTQFYRLAPGTSQFNAVAKMKKQAFVTR
jgi:hypothetical protein